MLQLTRRIAFLVSTLSLSLVLPTAVAQETLGDTTPKAILGIVVPGYTTLAELEETLTAKGCKFKGPSKNSTEATIEIGINCFDLPGKPVIEAVAPSSDKPIQALSLNFRNTQFAPYDFYYETLIKAYGLPTASVENKNIKGVQWNRFDRGLGVALVKKESKDQESLLLLYGLGPEAQAHWKEFSQDLFPEPTKDSELL
ncbi:MAG: hypothetical protein LUC43_03670 [Burkholderiales bacterium]|nr:hypothetical protein [Burkholderiales bacterium]